MTADQQAIFTRKRKERMNEEQCFAASFHQQREHIFWISHKHNSGQWLSVTLNSKPISAIGWVIELVQVFSQTVITSSFLDIFSSWERCYRKLVHGEISLPESAPNAPMPSCIDTPQSLSPLVVSSGQDIHWEQASTNEFMSTWQASDSCGFTTTDLVPLIWSHLPEHSTSSI